LFHDTQISRILDAIDKKTNGLATTSCAVSQQNLKFSVIGPMKNPAGFFCLDINRKTRLITASSTNAVLSANDCSVGVEYVPHASQLSDNGNEAGGQQDEDANCSLSLMGNTGTNNLVMVLAGGTKITDNDLGVYYQDCDKNQFATYEVTLGGNVKTVNLSPMLSSLGQTSGGLHLNLGYDTTVSNNFMNVGENTQEGAHDVIYKIKRADGSVYKSFTWQNAYTVTVSHICSINYSASPNTEYEGTYDVTGSYSCNHPNQDIAFGGGSYAHSACSLNGGPSDSGTFNCPGYYPTGGNPITMDFYRTNPGPSHNQDHKEIVIQ
jgi:hypothetical protein